MLERTENLLGKTWKVSKFRGLWSLAPLSWFSQKAESTGYAENLDVGTRGPKFGLETGSTG